MRRAEWLTALKVWLVPTVVGALLGGVVAWVGGAQATSTGLLVFLLMLLVGTFAAVAVLWTKYRSAGRKSKSS